MESDSGEGIFVRRKSWKFTKEKDKIYNVNKERDCHATKPIYVILLVVVAHLTYLFSTNIYRKMNA